MNKMNEVKPLGNLALEVVVQWEQRYVSAKPNKRICRVTSSLFLPFPLPLPSKPTHCLQFEHLQCFRFVSNPNEQTS